MEEKYSEKDTGVGITVAAGDEGHDQDVHQTRDVKYSETDVDPAEEFT